MVVKRIVRDIETQDFDDVRRFYTDLFDLTVVMDQGWIVTLASEALAPCQISIAAQGGSGAPTPDLSIEVDDVDAYHTRAQEMGLEIVYALCDEPWGVRRFFVRDPVGQTLNVLGHL